MTGKQKLKNGAERYAVQVYLPPETHVLLRRKALADSRSISATIRHLIHQYVSTAQ